MYSKIVLNSSRDPKKSDFSPIKLKHLIKRPHITAISPVHTHNEADIENQKVPSVITQVKLPKIYFSLSPSNSGELYSTRPLNLKIDNLSSLVSSSKLLSIYESISCLEKSLSSPKLYLDESVSLSRSDLNQNSKEFFRAIKLDKELKVLRMLKRNQSLINIRDSVGKTPLHWAVIRNNTPITQILLSFGADMNALDYCKRTPKQFAIHNNSNHMIQLIKSFEVSPPKKSFYCN